MVLTYRHDGQPVGPSKGRCLVNPDLKALKELHRSVDACWETLTCLMRLVCEHRSSSSANDQDVAERCSRDFQWLYSCWSGVSRYEDSDVDWFAGDQVVSLCNLKTTSYHRALALLAGLVVNEVFMGIHGSLAMPNTWAPPPPSAGANEGDPDELGKGINMIRQEAEATIQSGLQKMAEATPLLLPHTIKPDNLEDVMNILESPLRYHISDWQAEDVLLTPEELSKADPWLSLEYNRALRRFVPERQPLEPSRRTPRYRPPPCPCCGGKAEVTSSPRGIRHLKCSGCAHTWTVTRRPV